MTEQNEKLSYLLDDFPGENPQAEIDEVIGDVNLQYQMRRYQMIGEAMRNELPRAIDTDFHSTVMDVVRAEALHGVSTASSGAVDMTETVSPLVGWLSRPLAGLAVAATVAVVTVALWTPAEQNDSGGNQIATGNPDTSEVIPGYPSVGEVVTVSTAVQPQGMRWKIDNDAPALQQKLNGYLVNHTEYSNSVQGLIPQARVAGFDAQQ